MKFSPFIFIALLAVAGTASARPITAAGLPAVLDIRAAGASSLRITLRPESFKREFPDTPVLPERDYPRAVLSLHEIKKSVAAKVAGLRVEVQPEPLRIIVSGKDGTVIQS
ncbi:MAG: hypothetical protein RL616_2490, partial [Verrucomicrobiota bacterium]